MINLIKKIFAKPSYFISSVGLVVLVATLILYIQIGRAPVIPDSLVLSNSKPTMDIKQNTSLAFSKAGKLETLMVKVGDQVKVGQVIAKLAAPEALGTLNQAKASLDLAQAEFNSLSLEYTNTKKQQDLIVSNALKTLLSTDLEGVASEQDQNVPIISGTYNCDKEGQYLLKSYASGDFDSGFSLNYSGLESGTVGVKYYTSIPLGQCGLMIKFSHVDNFQDQNSWVINIPNTNSNSYQANKNAYDFALDNREKILADLSTKLGLNESTTSVAKAQINLAEGAYQSALGAYSNNLITSPIDGVVTFIDPDLKVGQTVVANKSVISLGQN